MATRLYLVESLLTDLRVDAIVCPTDDTFFHVGDHDTDVLAAAGKELAVECRALKHCPVGGAVVTRGYKLPARHIIFTSPKMWIDGTYGEADVLAACHRSCFEAAKERGFKSIALPNLALGRDGFPEDLAASISAREIAAFIRKNAIPHAIILAPVYSDMYTAFDKAIEMEIGESIDVEWSWKA